MCNAANGVTTPIPISLCIIDDTPIKNCSSTDEEYKENNNGSEKQKGNDAPISDKKEGEEYKVQSRNEGNDERKKINEENDGNGDNSKNIKPNDKRRNDIKENNKNGNSNEENGNKNAYQNVFHGFTHKKAFSINPSKNDEYRDAGQPRSSQSLHFINNTNHENIFDVPDGSIHSVLDENNEVEQNQNAENQFHLIGQNNANRNYRVMHLYEARNVLRFSSIHRSNVCFSHVFFNRALNNVVHLNFGGLTISISTQLNALHYAPTPPPIQLTPNNNQYFFNNRNESNESSSFIIGNQRYVNQRNYENRVHFVDPDRIQNRLRLYNILRNLYFPPFWNVEQYYITTSLPLRLLGNIPNLINAPNNNHNAQEMEQLKENTQEDRMENK